MERPRWTLPSGPSLFPSSFSPVGLSLAQSKPAGWSCRQHTKGRGRVGAQPRWRPSSCWRSPTCTSRSGSSVRKARASKLLWYCVENHPMWGLFVTDSTDLAIVFCNKAPTQCGKFTCAGNFDHHHHQVEGPKLRTMLLFSGGIWGFSHYFESRRETWCRIHRAGGPQLIITELISNVLGSTTTALSCWLNFETFGCYWWTFCCRAHYWKES